MTVTVETDENVIFVQQNSGASAGTINALISAALPYKVYTALLTQTGTNAPIASVLQNTLDNTIIWTRLDTGLYRATLSSHGTFTNRTGIMIGCVQPFLGSYARGDTQFLVNDEDEAMPIVLNVRTTDINQMGDATLSDGCLVETFIEIRIYP